MATGDDDQPDTAPGATKTPHFHGHRQRLKDRFLKTGGDQLADYELLELVLFQALPRRDVKPLAKDLLDRFGSFAGVATAGASLFRVLYLNRKNVLIKDEVQWRGTIDHTPLYPREVVKRALELQAAALIMVHNHPSGDPTPSQADIDMTRQVAEAAQSMGIVLHDHLIIAKSGHTSFRDMGYL